MCRKYKGDMQGDICGGIYVGGIYTGYIYGGVYRGYIYIGGIYLEEYAKGGPYREEHWLEGNMGRRCLGKKYVQGSCFKEGKI
jgi:hypothetical protein